MVSGGSRARSCRLLSGGGRSRPRWSAPRMAEPSESRSTGAVGQILFTLGQRARLCSWRRVLGPAAVLSSRRLSARLRQRLGPGPRASRRAGGLDHERGRGHVHDARPGRRPPAHADGPVGPGRGPGLRHPVLGAHVAPIRAAGRRDDGEPLLAVTSALRGRGTHLQRDHERTVQPFAVWATNMSEPYVHQVSDTWTITAKLPLHLLGVPEGLAIPALEQVGRSPLAPLFSQHLAEVRRVGDDLDRRPRPPRHGHAGARAGLVTSVSSDGAPRRTSTTSCCSASRLVRQHLGDPGLARPASPRRSTCRSVSCTGPAHEPRSSSSSGSSSSASSASTRSSPGPPTAPPVTVLAQRWGFTSAAHFTRRFRAAYGMSPREWQAMNRSARRSGRMTPCAWDSPAASPRARARCRRSCAELGAVVIDADQLAREVVAKGTPGLAQVVEAFGPEVLTAGRRPGPGQGRRDRLRRRGPSARCSRGSCTRWSSSGTPSSRRRRPRTASSSTTSRCSPSPGERTRSTR